MNALQRGRTAARNLLLRAEGRLGVLGPAHRRYSANSAEWNRETWGEWDWGELGEEWTPSEDWKQGLIEYVLEPNIAAGDAVIEIGPGGGRWTEVLLGRASQLTLVDVTETTLDLCRERFGNPDTLSAVANDGRSLPGILDASIDSVWSYDAFVHVAPTDIKSYLGEVARVLRPGGRGVIHHSGRLEQAGWRSPMTGRLFARLARNAGLEVERQFDSWGPNGEFDVRAHGDTITVFTRPAG